jgi:16S rRNA processing protein RimM
MSASQEFIPVGKISGTFGVKGWMKIYSFTDPRENILNYSPLYIDRKGEWVELKVNSGRIQGKGIVIGVEGVTDPDQVIPLIGSELAITKQQMKPTSKDEYYWSQLIGMNVKNEHDVDFGEVTNLLETGAHDVLVVQNKQKNSEQLIPFVLDDIVLDVDVKSNVILVDWELDY